MEREKQRKYPIFEQLSTEELENLLAQDFAATDGADPDVDYIMAIMEVINEREKAAGHQSDVDAAWKDFQEEYKGQAAAFDRTIHHETDSSDHHQTSSTQVSHKKTRVFRYVIVAAAFIALLGGTASGFGRVFQAVVNWTAETFGFEAPYGKDVPAEQTALNDPYNSLRSRVAEYTDLPVIPKWAPEGTIKAPDTATKVTDRKDSIQLSGIYDTNNGRFLIRIQIHSEAPPQYTVSYQWDESYTVIPHNAGEISHDIAYNTETITAAWTNENVECMVQGDLTIEDLEMMIDSIYEE